MRLWSAFVTAVLLTFAVGGAALASDAIHKVFVCKYVGTPGVDERLQTGGNPISVDLSSIPGAPADPNDAVGFEFADAQGRSLVLAVDVGQPEPPVSDCPPPIEPTPPPPTATPEPTPTPTPLPPPPTPEVTPEVTPPPTEQTTPPPSEEPTPTPVPSPAPSNQFAVLIHEPICDGDVPILAYEVQVTEPQPDDTLTITWVNPTGPDVVYSDLPLAGAVLWPGAVVDAAGNPIDWPGWTQLPDGSWVEGDEFDWVRPSVTVIFSVNPEATFSIGYPPATPTCDANPPQTPPKKTAPPTDVESGGSSGGAALFLVLMVLAAVGSGALLGARRQPRW